MLMECEVHSRVIDVVDSENIGPGGSNKHPVPMESFVWLVTSETHWLFKTVVILGRLHHQEKFRISGVYSYHLS